MAKWMFEPATGMLREVQAAAGGAGTGMNGGDWEWIEPPNYKTSHVVPVGGVIAWNQAAVPAGYVNDAQANADAPLTAPYQWIRRL